MKELCFKAILLCFCLLASINAFAYDAEIDGIYYNFSGDEATVTFKHPNDNYEYHSNYSGNILIPEVVSYNGKTYSITTIGDYAFSFSNTLISVSIPKSVTYIGIKAFNYCRALTSVTIPESVTSIGNEIFSGCNTLTSIDIPNSVTSIGECAFKDCSGLTSVTIPNSVTSIGYDAFEGCTGLTAVYITDLAAWCNISFEGFYSPSSSGWWEAPGNKFSQPLLYAHHLYLNGHEVTNLVIPEGITSISGGAFSGCSGLTSINISSSVTTIGYGAFMDCKNLKSVAIPENVTSIDNDVFQGCDNLTSMTLSCKEIGSWLKDIASLEEVYINNSVTKIISGAFSGCNSLTSVHITDLVAWCNTYFESNSNPLRYVQHLYLNNQEIKNLVIPNNITNIGSYVFSGCDCLTSVTIPESVTSIGNYAFSGCSNLTSISIPNSVTTIGNYAFSGCGSLTYISIPNSVTTIGNYAFNKCSSLTSITIPGSVTVMGWEVFSECTSLTSVRILDGVTAISAEAFRGCITLTTMYIPNSVTNIGERAFRNCTNLTSIIVPESVTSIGESAFKDCKLRNLLVKCVAPPSIGTDAFSEQTFYHTTLYVPVGCWDAYAYDNTWYKFHNIRETATTEEEVSAELAFMLMDAEKFTYSVYDPVNDQINTINSVGINEDNPNHSWQMIEAGGAHFLYNIGAKKYVKRNGNRLEMTDVPEPIDVENGENGLVLGAQTAQQWALVSNEHMNVAQSAIDEVTGISDLNATVSNSPIYNLAGQRLSKMQKGINIRNGKKVLIK